MNTKDAIAELNKQLPMLESVASQVICPKPSTWDKLVAAIKTLITPLTQAQTIESIHWKPCAEEMPPIDKTVLFYRGGDHYPLWFGWYDGQNWNEVDASTVDEEVTHWAEIPTGPLVNRKS